MGYFRALQMIYATLATVLSIERQFGRGNGQRKHQLAVQEIANTYRGTELATGEHSVNTDALIATINALVAAIVSVLKLLGVI